MIVKFSTIIENKEKEWAQNSPINQNIYIFLTHS